MEAKKSLKNMIQPLCDNGLKFQVGMVGVGSYVANGTTCSFEF